MRKLSMRVGVLRQLSILCNRSGTKSYFNDFIFVLLFFTCLNIVLTLSSQHILIHGFTLLEEQHARQNLNRAVNTLHADIADIGRSVVNEAFWDETYEYIQKKNPDFISASKVIPNDLNLNLIMYIDLEGHIVYGETYNATLDQIGPVPPPLRHSIVTDPLIWKHTTTESYREGILSTPTGLLLIAARPILNNQQEGPARGTLLFGRSLDKNTIQELEERLESTLTVTPLNASQIRDFVPDSTRISITPLNEQTVEAATQLKDVNGNVVLRLSSQIPRTIMWQGQKTVTRFLQWIYWGSLLVGILIWGIIVKWRLSQQATWLSEEKYKKLFNWTEVAIFEEDLSGVYAGLERLRHNGLVDLKEYLVKNKSATWSLLGQAQLNKVNKMALKTFQVKTKEELQVFFPNNIPPIAIDSAIDILCAIWSGEKQFRCETVNIDCKGKETSVILAMPIPNSIDEARCIPISVVDISERKETELALEEHAKTKTTLLQEVNHRVTNNLSAILVMLHLGKEKVLQRNCPARCSEPFDEVEARIFNLSMVHSMLTNARWQPLQLKELCETIVCQTIEGLSPTTFGFHIEGTDLAVSSDMAHNLTLIMGELAVNSTKHARVENRVLAVSVVIHNQDGRAVVTYADNGPGFPQLPSQEDSGRKSIGWEMMRSIVTGSMAGEIEFYNNCGACVRISFPNISA